ncbi:MAG: hypothetical protein ABI591_11930 [Kofleriaceae bacterium]
MTKLLIASALALSAAPAVAGPNPPPAISPTTIQIGLKVDGGKDQRHYTVKLVDKACGSVNAKTAAIHDEIKVCAHVDGANVHLDVQWQLHEKDRDIENDSEMVITRGVTQELDGGTAKLSVALT